IVGGRREPPSPNLLPSPPVLILRTPARRTLNGTAMFNSLRKLLRPALRQQLEDGVREALRRYADRRIAPDLRVYVSTDLVPDGMSAGMFARDEGEHLRRFAAQWAQDNGIARAGIRVEIILLDTKKEFAFVKPLGLV